MKDYLEIDLELKQDEERKKILKKLIGKRVALEWKKRIMRGYIKRIEGDSLLFYGGNEKPSIHIEIRGIRSVVVYR